MGYLAAIGSNADLCGCGYTIRFYNRIHVNQHFDVACCGSAGPPGQATPESAGIATSADTRVRSWKGATKGLEKGCIVRGQQP